MDWFITGTLRSQRVKQQMAEETGEVKNTNRVPVQMEMETAFPH
jgi:hypothetical protein